MIDRLDRLILLSEIQFLSCLTVTHSAQCPHEEEGGGGRGVGGRGEMSRRKREIEGGGKAPKTVRPILPQRGL